MPQFIKSRLLVVRLRESLCMKCFTREICVSTQGTLVQAVQWRASGALSEWSASCCTSRIGRRVLAFPGCRFSGFTSEMNDRGSFQYSKRILPLVVKAHLFMLAPRNRLMLAVAFVRRKY